MAAISRAASIFRRFKKPGFSATALPISAADCASPSACACAAQDRQFSKQDGKWPEGKRKRSTTNIPQQSSGSSLGWLFVRSGLRAAPPVVQSAWLPQRPTTTQKKKNYKNMLQRMQSNARTAYSWPKVKSVMETSSRIMLNSRARSSSAAL